MPITTDISWYKGEDVIVRVTMTPFGTNITGWTLAFTVRQNYGDTATVISKTSGAGQITITDALNGIFDVTVAAADTSGLVPRAYVFDASRTDSGAASVLSVGQFTLKAEVRV